MRRFCIVLRPARSDQSLVALLLRTVAVHELWQRQPLLELDSVHRHGASLDEDVRILARCITAAGAAVRDAFAGAQPVCLGHLGDGHLHYNVRVPWGTAACEWVVAHEADVAAVVYDMVLQMGGLIAAEHGIGTIKRPWLRARKGSVAIGLMRAIKQALDPQDLFNPRESVAPS